MQVTCGDVTETFFIRYIGTKGDWPFLRAAFRLKTGYTSKRKCHLCPATESWHVIAYHFNLFFLGSILASSKCGQLTVQVMSHLRIGSTLGLMEQPEAGPAMVLLSAHITQDLLHPFGTYCLVVTPLSTSR